jgi:hypothetical protein
MQITDLHYPRISNFLAQSIPRRSKSGCFSDVRLDPPRLIFREQLCRCRLGFGSLS